MRLELKLLISKLAKDTQIPYKSLSLAVKKAIISGRISQEDLISVLRKVAE